MVYRARGVQRQISAAIIVHHVCICIAFLNNVLQSFGFYRPAAHLFHERGLCLFTVDIGSIGEEINPVSTRRCGFGGRSALPAVLPREAPRQYCVHVLQYSRTGAEKLLLHGVSEDRLPHRFFAGHAVPMTHALFVHRRNYDFLAWSALDVAA